MTTKIDFSQPLPILISARVRLSEVQRKALKDKYYELKNADVQTSAVGTGGLAVQTAYGANLELEKKLQMSHMVFTDLINSRDSVSLTILLNIQRALGIEVITPQNILDASQRYVDYVFNKED